MCAIYPSRESVSGILDAPAAKWDRAGTLTSLAEKFSAGLKGKVSMDVKNGMRPVHPGEILREEPDVAVVLRRFNLL